MMGTLGQRALLTAAMPWSPTMAFQHPLVTVKDSNAEPGVTNYLTFTMAEVLWVL
jgi:sterol 3beta-glucosyltransferase